MLDDLLKASGLPHREAMALLEAASGQRRETLIAHGSDPAPREVQALFERMAAQRRLGMPIAYLTGFREFYGRPFWVSPATLIPRIETELLVDTVIDLAKAAEEPLRLADLGTGSGCIGITLALEIRLAEITATDQSAAALQVARNNAVRLGAVPQTRFFQGSWFHALPQSRVKYHGLISNPPYVGAGDPHLSRGDLRFEPKAALSPGALDGIMMQPDGLSDIATLAKGAPQWLEPGGFLLVEHGSEQQAAVIALFRQAGLTRVRGLADDQSLPRAVIGFLAS
ncbi:MAG: peptide chain release factor N(5)-glutamine methyltransferase [Betaproteobacteria bacterium]|jgi:release factor glutamine methyltransferase|nr:peptide chain release factor N(5)-glutamine methyltransferase [Betaproteobacteria bacterium]